MTRRRASAAKSSSSSSSSSARAGENAATPPPSKTRAGAARALRTLPSAGTTQRLARTPSKITELLDHAHQHVELAMRLCDPHDPNDGDHHNDDDDWPSMAGTACWPQTHTPLLERGHDDTVVGRARLLLARVLLRKKQRLARLTRQRAGGGGDDGDARFRRLQQGYATLTQHVQDARAARVRLEAALAAFRKHAVAMESVLPPEPRDSRVMTTSLQACFAQTAGLVDALLATLTQDVAAQTQAKADQLAAFQETLARRDRLYVDAAVAKQQLDQFYKLKAKQRSAVPGAYDLELAQRKHEYAVLRRRVAALTAATEHVFQFHASLDQCIVDPEMATVHRQLTRLFERHARTFEKNVQ